MHVQVLAPGDRLHTPADIDAVLDDGIAHLVVLERNLVADRDIALRRHGDVFIVFHDPAGERLPGLHAFDHDDTHAIAFFMHHEMDHRDILFV